VTGKALIAIAIAFVFLVAGSAGAAVPPSFACTDIGAKPVAATIVGTQGNDTLTGTSGRDVIAGLGGDDVIDGGGGNDLICGGDGSDRLSGGAGEDVLSGDAGDDVLDGGGQPADGTDFAAYDASPAAVVASLRSGTATGWGSDQLRGVEGLSGSPFGDSLVGNGGDNVLLGQRGNDRLSGLGGSDLLSGTDGNDAINGGAGPDLAFYRSSPRGVRVDLAQGIATGWGRDRLRSIEDVVGSSHADRLLGNGGANYLWGLGGADLIDGRGGRDHAFGGPGRDRCIRAEMLSSC
jgi:Ca2+-binding RTX toxin-like protein